VGIPEQPAAAAGVLRSIRCALWILAAAACVAMLRLGRDLLIPLLLAVLLALILSGVVERLRRIGIPRALSALLLLLVLGAVTVGMVDALSNQAHHWIESAPRVLSTIEHRVRPAQLVVRQVDAITRRARAIAGTDAKDSVVSVGATPAVTAAEVISGTGALAGEIAVGMALALLMLAAGPAALGGMVAALIPEWRAASVVRIIDAVRAEVGRYYGTLALINIGFGLVVGVMMGLFGMPNPVLWGAMAGVLNFVPYLGCALTLTLLTLVSLVSFDALGHTVLVAVSFLVVAGFEGHIIEPLFFGRRFNLSPIVILIALWVGGWMWGIAGVVFTMPTLVAINAATAHRRRGSFVPAVGLADSSQESSGSSRQQLADAQEGRAA
jgi:predicted PurR-regulated permease PerM